MGLRDRITKTFSLSSPPSTATLHTSNEYELAAQGKVVVDSSKPIGIKTAPAVTAEASAAFKLELEAAYRFEPNVFNGINKTTQLIMAAGYHFEGDPRSVSFFEGFFNSIGERGGEMEWEEMLTSIFKHQMIYGEAWNEKIPAKRNRDKIVDLLLLDPKKMGFAKDGNSKIVLDEHGDPVGYVETLPPEHVFEERYKAPEGVALQSNQIFFPPDKLAHYKLYTVGDGFNGTGLVAPVYNVVKRKLALEEALANSNNRNGFPIKVVKVGDERHEPTDQMIQRIVEKIEAMNYRGVIAHPNWMDIKMLQPESPERLQEIMKYYIDQIVTGLGLPKALVTGIGAETNRRTLDRQEMISRLTLKDIVRRTVRIIEKQIIQPVAASNRVKPVKMVWGEMLIEDLDRRAKRLATYAKVGLVTPDEGVERKIRGYEELPEAMPDASKDAERQPAKATKEGK